MSNSQMAVLEMNTQKKGIKRFFSLNIREMILEIIPMMGHMIFDVASRGLLDSLGI